MKIFILILSMALVLFSLSFGQYCDPPGEAVGTTHHLTQVYGSSSQRIRLDFQGGIHIAWTERITSPGDRNIFYNFRDENGNWLSPGEGIQVNQNWESRYASLAIDSLGIAAIGYYFGSCSGYVFSKLARNFYRGSGDFYLTDIPNLLPDNNFGAWPQVAISSNGDIHTLITEFYTDDDISLYLAYTRSEDGGVTWTAPAIIDTVAPLISSIVASPTGEVAIVYLKPTDLSEFHTVKNDLCYIESSDGRIWDFGYPYNITDYLNDNEDTFCPWGQDAVYDFNGNLNVVWVINNIDADGRFIDHVTGLCHFAQNSETITLVAEMPDSELNCLPNFRNSSIGTPTVSIKQNGNIAIVYTGFIDGDESNHNRCNGDLYLVLGNTYQDTWLNVGNITETHTPNCSGDCESEEFPSLSEIMQDSTHLTYVKLDFGSNLDTIYYLPIEVPNMTGVQEEEYIPGKFQLLGNYPNPFNAQTTIEFTLGTQSDVELTIYDITGAKVMSVERPGLEDGQHSIVWDAGEVASGIYFARIEAGDYSKSIKMVLLK